MADITVQKVPKKTISANDILIQFCYIFPQYKLSEAKKMPYLKIQQMLKVAEKIRAQHMLELTQIVAGPHSKDGKGTKNMIELYKSILED